MQRILRFVVIGLVVGSAVTGGIALASSKGGDYRPGKGCGDKWHTHYREDDCKPPKDHGHGEHGGAGNGGVGGSGHGGGHDAGPGRPGPHYRH